MAVIAMITAGGSGSRMHQNIPKQFLTFNERPVIVYTLEAFEKHPEIDAIAVVCIEGWQNVLEAYSQQFNITKLKHIIPGGKTGYLSIRNGITELSKHFSRDDMVLIHDSIRPMLSPEIISNCIRVASKYGNAVTVIDCPEAMMTTEDGLMSSGTYINTHLMRTQTPQAFYIGEMLDIYKKADEAGITDAKAPCSLMENLGVHMHFAAGSEKNLKLTTVEDIDIFKALLKTERSSWLK